MKVVDLREYKSQKELKKQIEELDRIGDEHYQRMTPVEQKGYRNFMRLLKAVDSDFGEDPIDAG